MYSTKLTNNGGQRCQTLALIGELPTLDECETISVPARDVADMWEQLFDDGHMGRLRSVRRPESDVFQLRGFLFVLYPELLMSPSPFGLIPSDLDAFYRDIIAPILGRHPLLAKAEVRNCGDELHVILWFDEDLPLACEDQNEEEDLLFCLEEAHLAISHVMPCSQRSSDRTR